MSDTRYWEASFRTKLWRDMNPDEKAEWIKAELQRMRSLFVMLSAQVQETGRKVKAIQEQLKEGQQVPPVESRTINRQHLSKRAAAFSGILHLKYRIPCPAMHQGEWKEFSRMTGGPGFSRRPRTPTFAEKCTTLPNEEHR
jgi:hypothetical protein